MKNEGYLYTSSLVPRAEVTALYDAIMQTCREEGWADDRNFALGELRLEGHEGSWAVYDRVQRLEA